MRTLGLDTSNYTTSAALFDGEEGYNAGKLLEVPEGQLGLRQSEALFQHIKALPDRMQELRKTGPLKDVAAVAASTRPREVEGSYMPCFLAGESLGHSLAHTLNVPFFAVSHQQGHLAAAAWSAGHMELLDRPFLAWHLSGGTTELLYVEPDGVNVRAEKIGGTSDISAGQLIDRTGVLLGLAFPAGPIGPVLYAAAQAPAACSYRIGIFPLRGGKQGEGYGGGQGRAGLRSRFLSGHGGPGGAGGHGDGAGPLSRPACTMLWGSGLQHPASICSDRRLPGCFRKAPVCHG